MKTLRLSFTGIFGLCVIAVSLLIALLGYVITPDRTEACNAMHLELALRKPGYKATFLQQKNSERTGLLQLIQKGEPMRESVYVWDSGGDTAIATVESHREHIVSAIHGSSGKYELVDRYFFLGTDLYGRDVWSRILLGTRISLSVGLISVLISMLLGLFLGMMAGYYRGWIDRVVMWLVNVVWSMPTLLLVIALTFALGKGFWQVFLAVGLTMWVELARIVRAQVFSLKNQEFIQAARVLGFSDVRIMLRHILPNLSGPVIVICAANFASAILLEAGLSFLGLGVQPPFPSWGQMLKEHYSFIAFHAAHLALAPGIAIMLLVVSFNYIGNWLRDLWDVKL